MASHLERLCDESSRRTTRWHGQLSTGSFLVFSVGILRKVGWRDEQKDEDRGQGAGEEEEEEEEAKWRSM